MPESERSELPAASDSHVVAVSRALRVLNAFYGDESFVSLAELARRTGMHKPTVLRLARTLEHARYLVRREDGAWRLGPSAGLLGARYQVGPAKFNFRPSTAFCCPVGAAETA